MTQSIKLTNDQMQLMSLFQNVTSVTARDCIEDEKQNRVIFVVNSGKMGLAIGKHGANIKNLRKMIKRNIEMVEHNDDPAVFLKNLFRGKLVEEVKLSTRADGAQQAIVMVDPVNKGLVLGRDGCNAQKARMLAKRYFEINNVLINSTGQPKVDL